MSKSWTYAHCGLNQDYVWDPCAVELVYLTFIIITMQVLFGIMFCCYDLKPN